MKRIKILLWAFLFLHVGILFWANRANFISSYDASYWKDRYEHSQWRLPLSPRTLGDNGLYAFEGYQLIQGADPTSYNAEIPPLGKYIIGLNITLFHNSPLYGALCGIIVLILLFWLSKKLLHTTLPALAVTLWFATDPLFVSQWTATMLDTLHLSFLLLFFITLSFLDTNIHTRRVVALAGITLGLFSAVKYPILSVVIVVTSCYYIWHKTKSFFHLGIFLICTLVTYIATFFRYFSFGHTLTDWVGLQKWMFSFYAHSKLTANIGSIWTTLLINRYQNLFTKIWQSASEWSIAWPIITVSSSVACFEILRKRIHRNHVIGTIVISLFVICIFYSFTSFWTRYLTLILPFLYIAFAALVKHIKEKRILFVIIFSLLFVNVYVSYKNIFPTPESDVKQFVYDWEHGFFSDMYERFTIDAKAGIDRTSFDTLMHQRIHDGEIENIQIAMSQSSWTRTNPQNIPIQITYFTRNLGEFILQSSLPLVNENGAWKIRWSDELFIDGLTDETSLQTIVTPAKRGSIIDKTKGVLAEDSSSSMIWITPKLIDPQKEEAMLHFLETLFGNPPYSAINFYHRYSIYTIKNWPIPIAVLHRQLDTDTINTLTSFPGITLTPAFGRFTSDADHTTVGDVANTHYFECCSLLYTTTTYDGVSGLEQLYNVKLKGENGGTLNIVNNNGDVIRTLISKEKRDGENISL
jgi:predicted membrane-bound dolichyl-phosphate-mannose-protein mannosyltransferase